MMMSGKTNLVRVTIRPGSLSVARSEDHAGSLTEDAAAGAPMVSAAVAPLIRVRNDGEPCRSPAVDIHEGEGGLILEADLPGADESSIIVQLEDNLLHLYAKIESAVPPGAKWIHEEYRVGDFARTFILSHEVDLDRIRAEWKQGVLRLIMPTSPRGASRRIEVKGQ